MLARWHAEFDDLRRRREAKEDDLQAATWAHYQEEIETHRRDRQSLPTTSEIEAAKDTAREAWRTMQPSETGPAAFIGVAADAMVLAGRDDLSRTMRAGRKEEIARHLGKRETVLANDAAREVIRREGFAIESDTPAFRDLAQRLLRAELEGLRRADEQDRGDYTGLPRDPMVKPPSDKANVRVAAPGESVMDVFEAFKLDNPKRIRPDTLRVNQQVVSMFSDFVGVTLPLRDVTKRSVSTWKAALRKYPTRAAEVRVFRSLSFKQIIAANEDLGRATLSDKTVNRYLSAIGGFCTWAVKNGFIENNPVTGLLIEKDREAEPKVHPYTSDQLSKIFHSPMFVGCLGSGKEHRTGPISVRDHRYWIPIISLFTGARINEIAQLLNSDIRKIEDRWVMVITREGDARKMLKTKSAQRLIPIHTELKRLGFVEFYALRSKSNDLRLFPEIKPDARGQLSGNYSRFYGRYIHRIGVKSDATLNFHSFRHGFIDALRRAGYTKEQYKCLIGHSKGDVTDNYGALQDFSLQDRVAMIDLVCFPDLDLSHLYL